ncbi:MAG TPA: outer membrane beta-barrel protein [Acidocella sp.]|jgi:hypothetical protein|nr:outer membrane beta-barrel protein [Acidocella sp.]
MRWIFVLKRADNWLFAALVICGASCAARDAHAQLIQEYFPPDIPGYSPNFSASVVNCMDAQDQAEGVEVGDFVIRPEISETAGYDSNTLGTPNSGSSEIDTNAGVRANSDWGRDALGASFSVDDRHFLNLPSASYTNWAAAAGGALTLGNDTATLSFSHRALNLAATDLGVYGVVTPVPYSIDDVRLSYIKLLGRFSVTPSLEFQNFTFGQSTGGVAINYSSLSHKTESGMIATRYEFSPGDAAVMIFRASQAQFQTAPSDNYVDLGGFAGLDFRGNRVIQFRTLFGLESRSFQQNTTQTVTTPTFELDMVWTPTDLDTVTATATREQDDPTSPFASNQTITNLRVELDHELRTDLFLTGYVAGGQSESQSNISGFGETTQTQLSFGVSALWNINRHLRGTLGYGYSRGVDSGVPAGIFGSGYSNFTANTVLLGISIFD